MSEDPRILSREQRQKYYDDWINGGSEYSGAFKAHADAMDEALEAEREKVRRLRDVIRNAVVGIDIALAHGWGEDKIAHERGRLSTVLADTQEPSAHDRAVAHFGSEHMRSIQTPEDVQVAAAEMAEQLEDRPPHG